MSELSVRPRVLGIDYGRTRIGVAISDELQMLAHPLETISTAPAKAAVARVAEIARSNVVERIIVGLPRHMNGSLGISADDALAFAETLRPLVRCEVTMCDERLSTMAANRALQEAGRKTRNTRGVVDQVAAQVILQSYLDRSTSARAPDL
ncbi:MAG: Holliday junction resolvase RuvX [Chthoniobacterales bacterium]